jgi:hypothetical protein
MKKLALALVCLVSLAFFASCDDPQVQDPKPAISILAEEGYIQDGDIIDLDAPYLFGFKVASNAETGVELSQLLITIDDEPWDTLDLTGKTEDIYRGSITYNASRDSIVGQGVINATLTDAKNNVATASISYSINQPFVLLNPTPFEWFRLGNNYPDMTEFGLKWEKNLKVTYAQIQPLDGVKLYIFSDPTVWENTKTDVDKKRLMQTAIETMQTSEVYKNVSTTAGGTYNDVIATITTDGVFHLIHVTECNIGAFESQGYPITIKGESK